MRIPLSAGLAFAALLGASVLTAEAATYGRSGSPGLQIDLEGQSFDIGLSVAGRFLAARHAESVGNLVAAADLTTGVLSEVPRSEIMSRRAHLVMVGAGRFEDAAAIADELIATRPQDPLVVYTLVVRALHQGEHTRSLALLDGIPDSGVNGIIAPLLKAWLLAGEGRTADGVAALDAMAGNAGLAPVAGFHQALIADLGGDIVGAEAAFRRTFAASGDRPSLQLIDSFARFLVRNGKTEEAAKLVADFVARNPQTLLIEPALAVVEGRAEPDRLVADVRAGASEVFRNVASLLNREQLRTEALLFVRMALDLAPNDASAKFSLAQLLEAREREDLAIEAYETIDPRSPYNWYARLGVADAMHAQGESDDAIRLLRAMSSERPERADAPRALADLFRVTERFDDAVAAYDQAAKRMDGEPDWGLLYTRGIALERAKRWDRAEQDFLQALDISPDQPLVLNYLGYSWVEQGVHLERARKMIETAVEKRPRDGYITDSLGWVLYRLGDFEAAVVHLERAVALEAGDPVINDHLGDAYWAVGRKLEARFQWMRSLSLEPDRDVEAELRLKLGGKKIPKPLPPGKKRDL
ncbi:MAG: tetratricopeptide repeat protein [Rhodospirillaceae bacterium]|nr:tetratricopeptide repeat protein [Rhodospirillaceae bacterium]MBT3810057.1 tetratricopeptide repeat protein [Rhodospirillaceae bacterium]MBT4772939.1 tetratricopeptide repeat protein [Rhodospirillaceae bacterium]MBT5358305.1 tetratricopeptide repeat protein [Rhodospirillaceae bacterium]MBT5767922.1 tetratricopeptide repeat protein [Rhodospirillaceae bacterium]